MYQPHVLYNVVTRSLPDYYRAAKSGDVLHTVEIEVGHAKSSMQQLTGDPNSLQAVP